MGERSCRSKYPNCLSAQAGHCGSRSGRAICLIAPDHISTVVIIADGATPHRIFIASATCKLAINDVIGPSTPAVSQVGCGPSGGSGYTHCKHAVIPGTTD